MVSSSFLLFFAWGALGLFAVLPLSLSLGLKSRKEKALERFPPENVKRIVDVGMDQFVVWNGDGNETMLVSHNFIDCVPLVCAAIDPAIDPESRKMIPPFLLSHISTDDKNYEPGTGHGVLSESAKRVLEYAMETFVWMSKEGMNLECSVVAREGRSPSQADRAVYRFVFEKMAGYQSARSISCPRVLFDSREGGSVRVEGGLPFQEGSFAQNAWVEQRKFYVHPKVVNTDDIKLPDFIYHSWNGRNAVYVPEKGEQPYIEGDGVLDAIMDVEDRAEMYEEQGNHGGARAASKIAEAMTIGLSADLAASLHPSRDIRFPHCVPPEWGRSKDAPADVTLVALAAFRVLVPDANVFWASSNGHQNGVLLSPTSIEPVAPGQIATYPFPSPRAPVAVKEAFPVVSPILAYAIENPGLAQGAPFQVNIYGRFVYDTYKGPDAWYPLAKE